MASFLSINFKPNAFGKLCLPLTKKKQDLTVMGDNFPNVLGRMEN